MPEVLPMRVAPSAVEAFIEMCVDSTDPRKAIADLARAFPGLPLRGLALYLEGAAHFKEVDGGMVLVVDVAPGLSKGREP